MIAVAMLAAGGSRRFGSPKQLTEYEGESLLRRACRAAADFNGRAIAVLGANADRLTAEVCGLEIVVNAGWSEGMSTSIHAAVHAVHDADALIIALADQPFVGTAELEALASLHRSTNAPAVAASYGGTLGAPALFHRSLFPELLALRGDAGAKQLLLRQGALGVPMEAARADIDAPGDLRICGERARPRESVGFTRDSPTRRSPGRRRDSWR